MVEARTISIENGQNRLFQAVLQGETMLNELWPHRVLANWSSICLKKNFRSVLPATMATLTSGDFPVGTSCENTVRPEFIQHCFTLQDSLKKSILAIFN